MVKSGWNGVSVLSNGHESKCHDHQPARLGKMGNDGKIFNTHEFIMKKLNGNQHIWEHSHGTPITNKDGISINKSEVVPPSNVSMQY